MPISRILLSRIETLLIPHLQNPKEREALIRSGLYGSNILNTINSWNDSATTFTRLLLANIEKKGDEYDDIAAILTKLRQEVGVSIQEEIDEILEEVGTEKQTKARTEKDTVPSPIIRAFDLAQHPSPQTRKDAFEFLKKHRHPSARKHLEELCNNDHPDVMMEAALVLASICNPPPLVCLDGLKMAADRNRLHGSARSYIAQMNNEHAVKALYEIYSNQKSTRQIETVNSISSITHPSVIPYLRTIYEERGFYDAVIALCKLGDKESLPLIKKFFLNTNVDHNIRSAQVRKFHKNFDLPTSEEFLIELLKALSQEYRRTSYSTFSMLIKDTFSVLQEIGTEKSLNELSELQQDREYMNIRNTLIGTINIIRRNINN